MALSLQTLNTDLTDDLPIFPSLLFTTYFNTWDIQCNIQPVDLQTSQPTSALSIVRFHFLVGYIEMSRPSSGVPHSRESSVAVPHKPCTRCFFL